MHHHHRPTYHLHNAYLFANSDEKYGGEFRGEEPVSKVDIRGSDIVKFHRSMDSVVKFSGVL